MKRRVILLPALAVLTPAFLSADDPKSTTGAPSAIFSVVRTGDLAMVKSLLAGKGDVNARHNDGSTLLMEAVVNADLAVVRFLRCFRRPVLVNSG